MKKNKIKINLKKKGKNNILALMGVAVVLFAVLSAFASIMPVNEWDENAYLANARSHISNSYYTEEFRFPLFEYFIAGVWFFTGESIFAARMLAVFLSVITLIFFYKIAKRLTDDKTALIGSLFFGFSSLMLNFGFKIYNDIVSLLFVIICFYLILISKDPKNKKQNNILHVKFTLKELFLFLAGISAGLAFLSRFTTALFPAIVILVFLKNKELKNTFCFCLGGFISLLPWLISNWVVYKNPLWDLIAQYTIVAQYTAAGPVSVQLKNLFYAAGPLLLLLVPALFLAFGLVKDKRSKSKQEKVDLDSNIIVWGYVLAYLIYIVFFVNIKLPRYFISFIGFLYLLFCFGLYYLIKNIRSFFVKRVVILIVIAWVIISASIAAEKMINDFSCNENGAKLASIDYLSDNTNPGENIISNDWPLYGYYNNLVVHSFWTDIPKLIDVHNPKYFVYNNLVSGYEKNLIETVAESGLIVLEKEIKDKCNEIISIYRIA